MLALRGWHKLHPVLSYPPLTWELTVLIALKMSVQSWPLAVGTLLAFDCFLRVGELVGLKREDVADSSDARLGAGFKGMRDLSHIGARRRTVQRWIRLYRSF